MTKLYKFVTIVSELDFWRFKETYSTKDGYLGANGKKICKQEGSSLSRFLSERKLKDLIRYMKEHRYRFNFLVDAPVYHFVWMSQWIRAYIIKELGVENVYPLERITMNKKEAEEAISYLDESEVYLATMPPLYFLNDDGDKDEKILSIIKKPFFYKEGHVVANYFKDQCCATWFTSLQELGEICFRAKFYDIDVRLECPKKLMSASQAKFIKDTIGLDITRV